MSEEYLAFLASRCNDGKRIDGPLQRRTIGGQVVSVVSEASKPSLELRPSDGHHLMVSLSHHPGVNRPGAIVEELAISILPAELHQAKGHGLLFIRFR